MKSEIKHIRLKSQITTFPESRACTVVFTLAMACAAPALNHQIPTSHLLTIAHKCYLGFPCLPELSSHYRVRRNRPAKAISTAHVFYSHVRYKVLFSLIVQRLFAP